MNIVDLEGFEDRYEISDDGIIYSKKHDRPIRTYRRPHNNTLMVKLFNGVTYVQRSVSRLVAKHFMEDFDETQQVFHIDGDHLNNSIENLEQTNYEEDTRWRRPWPRPVRIICVETGEVFRGPYEAARAVRGDVAAIYKCVTGERETHKGYHFERYKPPQIVYNDRKF